MKTSPQPPGHLSGPAKALWTAVLGIWRIDDPAHLAIFQAGLEARDRADSCRRQIDKEGETVQDRFKQTKPHPLLSAERDSRSAFLLAMKQLNLEPPEPPT